MIQVGRRWIRIAGREAPFPWSALHFNEASRGMAPALAGSVDVRKAIGARFFVGPPACPTRQRRAKRECQQCAGRQNNHRGAAHDRDPSHRTVADSERAELSPQNAHGCGQHSAPNYTLDHENGGDGGRRRWQREFCEIAEYRPSSRPPEHTEDMAGGPLHKWHFSVGVVGDPVSDVVDHDAYHDPDRRQYRKLARRAPPGMSSGVFTHWLVSRTLSKLPRNQRPLHCGGTLPLNAS